VIPHVRVRAPFSRDLHPDRGLRVSRRGVALSAAAHLFLVLAVWLSPVRTNGPRGDAPAEGSRGAATELRYLSVGDWPGAEGAAAAPEPAAGATEADGEQAVRTDSAAGSAPAAEPTAGAFPQRAPAGMPRAAPGPSRAGGAPAGVARSTTAVAGSGAAGGTGTARRGAAGGRLGTELGDERLIVTPSAAPPRVPTERERLNARIAERIRQMNDSTEEASARARRGRNWTVKDREGREWGIGEGGVPVIAGRRVEQVRLKPPIATDRDSELHDAEARRQTNEIDRQEEVGERDRIMRDRARATRERIDRERAERQRAGASGKP